MAQPTQLTPTEQDALVKQIGLAMLRVAPDDWEQLTVDYRSVGRYSEATAQVVFSDGTSEPWTMPADLQGLFARLRGGMYREGRGTWFNARYRLDHPSSYNLEYDREEPRWDSPPPPQAYPDDMRMFPRTEDNVPAWLRRRLSTAPPPRFRVARIFDGPPVDGGRPAVNRPAIDPDDVADLLKYLDNAPVVGPGRGFDIDRYDPEARPAVPVAFHTDGTWIWPAAVNYYLREHDVPPEPDLVEHVARSGFRPPMVDDQTRAAAAAFLGPGAGPGPGGPGGPGPAGPPRVPPPAAPAPTRALPVPPAQPPAQPPAPGGPPPAALPSQGPPGRTVDALRTRLDELGIPPTAYRIGPPVARTWTMDQTEEGWRVGWFDREFVAPAMFEDVADASAFLLGKLLLDADRWQSEPRAPGLPVPPAPVPPPADDPGDFALSNDPAESFAPPAPPTVVAPAADLPRRSEQAKRPDSPRPGFDFDRAEAPTRFSPPAEQGFDLPRPGSRPDSPFTRADNAFEPPRSESVFEPPEQAFEARHADGGFEPVLPEQARHAESGFDSVEQGFEPRRHEQSRHADPGGLADFDAGVEAPPSFEARRAEPSFEPRHSEPAHAEFDARHADPGLDPRRGEPSRPDFDAPLDATRAEPPFEPRRGEPALDATRAEPPFETRRGEPALNARAEPPFESHRGEPALDPTRAEPPFETRRGEPALDPTRAEPPFEPRRGEPALNATQAEPPFETRRGEPALNATRAETPFETRRGEPALNARAEPPFETRRSEPALDATRAESQFESRRGEPAFDPTRAEPPFEPRRGEPALDPTRAEPPFESRRGEPARSEGFEPRRASRVESMEATRVDPAVAASFRADPARHESPTTVAAPARPAATPSPANQEWPISPLPGEPPLTLFRGKRLVELPPGTEFDRFGEDDGNLAYAAGTPFHERSLVPEWVERPYHAYRVSEPVQVLTGTAIPWFEQPGGGTAYLLPEAIGDLLATGRVVEINGRERPPA